MPGRRFLIALAGALFLIVLIRTAWLSELSYLTLRTIEHAATGHGIRWNINERVQAFDHPLWMLLLLCGRMLTGEVVLHDLRHLTRAVGCDSRARDAQRSAS